MVIYTHNLILKVLDIIFVAEKMHRKLINFICFNETFLIELSLFNKHSNFFLNEDKIDENIYLLNEYDFIEYSKDDRLYQLPISTLYRIQQLFINKIKKEENTKPEQIRIQCKTIIDFLIKTVCMLGHDSLIFISSNKFNEEQFKYLNVQMSKIENINALNILTSFLQSNASYIIEYKKHKNILKEEETKEREKNLEIFKMKIEKEKKDFECTIKIIDGELQVLFDKFQPIKIPNKLIKISEKQFVRIVRIGNRS